MDYQKLLTEEILPKWIEITPDWTYGGVFTSFDKVHKPKTADKNVWFFGRGMWTYALAHRLCGPRQAYLDICEYIFHFLQKCTQPDGKLPHYVNREGEPTIFREITYYTEMFAAMGCAQYYRICGREEVKAQTELYMDYMYPRYLKQQHENQEEGAAVPCKCFGLHMAMLATAQFVRNTGIRVEACEKIISLAIEQMMHGGFADDENRRINEYVSLKGEKLSGRSGLSSCPGHIYEAAWFVLCEGEFKNDDTIRALGRKLVDYAMPQGFEKATDLIPTTYDLSKSVAENTASGDFLFWPQLEAVTAFRLAYGMFGEKRYLELSEQIEKTVFSYFDTFEDAIWFREIYQKNGQFISSRENGCHINGPFHTERVLLALSSLQKNGSILPYMK